MNAVVNDEDLLLADINRRPASAAETLALLQLLESISYCMIHSRRSRYVL